VWFLRYASGQTDRHAHRIVRTATGRRGGDEAHRIVHTATGRRGGDEAHRIVHTATGRRGGDEVIRIANIMTNVLLTGKSLQFCWMQCTSTS